MVKQQICAVVCYVGSNPSRGIPKTMEGLILRCVISFKISNGNTYYFTKLVPDTVCGLRPVGVMRYRKEFAYIFPSIKSACDVVSKIDRNRFHCIIVPYSYILRSLNVMKKWKNKSQEEKEGQNDG